MVEGNRSRHPEAFMSNRDECTKIYRATMLGSSLEEIISDMVRSNDLQEHHKDIIMSSFDQQVLESFKDMAKPSKPLKLTGVKTNYNFVDDCQVFKPKNCELKGEDGFQAKCEALELISINARNNRIDPPPAEPKQGKKANGRRRNHD